MADAKFIVIFMIMTSLFINIFSTQICGAFATANDNSLVVSFFILTTFTASTATCQVGVENAIGNTVPLYNETFVNGTNQLNTPSGGATGSFGTSSFIDVIKLISGPAALVGILLGLPLFAFLFYCGLPFAVATAISIFLAIMYAIGVMEFIRGGNF